MYLRTIDLTAGHEGYRNKAYLCTEGYWTIGYGYNLDANPLKLSKETLLQLKNNGCCKHDANDMLILMLQKVEHELAGKLPWISKLESPRQAVLIDMAYNIGVPRLMGFKKTLAALNRGDYPEAARQMLNSKWAKQVKTRAVHNAEIIRTGRFC
jgi:lysozyme